MFCGPSAAADVDEGADDVADHVIKETGGLHVHVDPRQIINYVALGDGSDGVIATVGGGGERLEVVCADQDGGGGLHLGDVESGGAVPAVADVADVSDFAGVDGVAVAFCFCAADGVEGWVDVFGAADGDVVGEIMIQRLHEIAGRDRGVEIDVGDLAFGVYAGVGAGGTDEIHPAGAEFDEGSLELVLDGIDIRLELPAMIGGAVVVDHEFYSSFGHRDNYLTTEDAEDTEFKYFNHEAHEEHEGGNYLLITS